MSKPNFCQECRTQIDGGGELCISCFSKLHQACPRCMIRCADGHYRPQMKGRPLRPIDCAYCNNDRWILAR